MAKRDYGTGQLYIVSAARYYGRWRTADGRKLNRKVGKAGTKASLGRADAGRGRAAVSQDAGGGGANARAPAAPSGERSTTRPTRCGAS